MDMSNPTPGGTLPFRDSSTSDVADVATRFRSLQINDRSAPSGSVEAQDLRLISNQLEVLDSISQGSACHVNNDSTIPGVASIPESVDIPIDQPPQRLVQPLDRDWPLVSIADFSDDIYGRYVEVGDLDEQCEALPRRSMQNERRRKRRRARKSDCERGSSFQGPFRNKIVGASRHRHNISPRMRPRSTGFQPYQERLEEHTLIGYKNAGNENNNLRLKYAILCYEWLIERSKSIQ